MTTLFRVVLNTGMMYVKTILTMGITLYSTRIILNELGASDFGIFNVVAGVIAMLSFLKTASTTSVRRFLADAMGKGDMDSLITIFSESIKVHLTFAICFVAFFEVLSIYLFNGFLNIAPNRMIAAYVVYQCTLFSTFFSILAIPYASAINSHEDIFVLSIIYIIDSFAKLAIAVYLKYTLFDKLIVYGSLLALTYSLHIIILWWYCHAHYNECKAPIRHDKILRNKIISFSGWSTLSNVSSVLTIQGSVILVNVFGGTIINAAYGIANQVNAQIRFFAASLLQAIEPQIMKSHGANDEERMCRLSLTASKLSFFLISFFSIPLIVRMEFVLKIWLNDVPFYTTDFCRIILATSIIGMLSMGLQSGIYAKGNIELYQILIGIVQILALPISYFSLKNGSSIFIVIHALLLVECIIFVVRIVLARKYISINLKNFLIEDVVPEILSVLLVFYATLQISDIMDNTIIGTFFLFVFSFSIYAILFWLLIVNKHEKAILKSMFYIIKNRLKHNEKE